MPAIAFLVMAGTVLVAALSYLCLGAMAYAITLSGRRVRYIAPLYVEAEVILGLGFLTAAGLAGVSAAVSLAVGDALGAGWGWAVGAALSLVLLLLLARRLLGRGR